MWWLFTTCLEWFCDSLRGLNPVKVMVLKMKMVLGYLSRLRSNITRWRREDLQMKVRLRWTLSRVLFLHGFVP
ncbi:hypothetical protein F2Q69_00033252 [Brassica cretica]|uniref:Uncharacterized protein n=1 Tax=Brassica cretica TaxID=69181 RepID=A0A8S9SL41_BRACR|nr:hypothetical protein F2Q69_00033252 [Brassica cretica]